jgi:hypothetical protein
MQKAVIEKWKAKLKGEDIFNSEIHEILINRRSAEGRRKIHGREKAQKAQNGNLPTSILNFKFFL